MTEDFEEKKSERPDFQRYLNLVRRRHIHFLIPFLLGWMAVWALSWMLPARYKSSTLILVERSTMAKNYVEPNVSDNLQENLQSIRQEILSRTRLLRIIDKLHLYSSGNKVVSPDQKVEQMGKDIEVELVRDNRGDQITAFRVNYVANQPKLAQQVTSELTNLFINETLKTRQQESVNTTEFIASQLENARASLSEQESKVRNFQGQHEGALPTQQTSNLQILAGLQTQLQNEQDSLNTAKQQRVYLQSLLEQYRAGNNVTLTSEGVPVGLSAVELELNNLRERLSSLQSHYTDHYPEVQSVKQQIAETEKRREKLMASEGNKGTGGKKSEDNPGANNSADASQSSPAQQLLGQLQASKVEIENREQSVARLNARLAEYQGRLNDEPVVEQQLADLTRGYEQSKANYDDLLKKKNQSEMATNMEQMQQGERFSILDPPSLPLKPDFPDKLKFCGIGLGVGLVLGVLVAGGLDYFDDRIYSENEIKSLLPVTIFSEIPEIRLPTDEQGDTRRARLGWSLAGLVTATVIAGSLISYIHE